MRKWFFRLVLQHSAVWKEAGWKKRSGGLEGEDTRDIVEEKDHPGEKKGCAKCGEIKSRATTSDFRSNQRPSVVGLLLALVVILPVLKAAVEFLHQLGN